MTYPHRCVNASRRFDASNEKKDYSVLMVELGIRRGMYGIVLITEAVKKNHDFPLRVRIDETSTAVEEIRVYR